jgi:hypothetical protein
MMMDKMKRGGCIVICIVMALVLSVFLVPITVEAVPIEAQGELELFGGIGIVCVEVIEQHDDQWQHFYVLSTEEPGEQLSIITMSVGDGSTVSGVDVEDVVPVPHEWNVLSPGVAYDTSDSLMIVFSPTLVLNYGQFYEFSILYDGLMVEQDVSVVTALGSSGGTLCYEDVEANNPVPEPTTLLLMGIGIFTMGTGIVSRKRRRR